MRLICGLPLVAWTVIQAKRSHRVDTVWLSTDSDEIANVGRAHGAEIIRRPDWPDADQVAANRVFLHALEEIDSRGKLPQRFACMFPTSPLRFPDDLDKGIEHHIRTGCEHVWPAWRRRETGIYKDVTNMIAKCVIWDKSYSFLEGNSGMYNVVNTNWYLWSTARLTETVSDHDSDLDAYGGGMNNWLRAFDTHSYYTECQQFQCVEVDTLPEFELAEVLMEHYILKGRGPQVYYDYQKRKPN